MAPSVMDRKRPPDLSHLIGLCPVCLSSPLTVAVRQTGLDIIICPDCGTSLSVPHDAWGRRERKEGSVVPDSGCD
jgi:hypothetical protein